MCLPSIVQDMKTNPLIFFLALSITTPLAYSQFHFSNWYCLENVGNYTTNSTYQNNLNGLLPNLTTQASLSAFGNSSLGEGIDKVYMLYSCRGDLTSTQCHDCVKEASKTIIEECPSEKESIVWYEECMLRYANRSIFSLEEESPFVWDFSTGSDSNPQLAQIVTENIDGLIEQAAYNETRRGYASSETNITALDDIYFLVQCTPDILGSRCERCLRAALRSMAGCCGIARSSLMIFYPSCHMRYDRAPVVLNIADHGAPRSPSPDLVSSPSILLPPPPPITDGSPPRMMRSYRDMIIIGLITVIGLFVKFTPN